MGNVIAHNERRIRKSAPWLDSWPRYMLCYTVAFAGLFLVVFGAILLTGASFFTWQDGASQTFAFLTYEGEWLRSIGTESAAAGALVIPQWDLSIGYGGDVITNLAFVLGDPLNLLTVFCGPESIEGLFVFLVLVRLYLTGITFSIYGRNRGHRFSWLLLGALAYAFSGYGFAVFHGVFFLNPLILFPLLLTGADRILRDEHASPILFVISVALLFASYVYLAYMASIFLLIYCLWNVSKEPRRLLRTTLRFIGYFLIGMALAAALLLPIVSVLSQSSRLGMERYVPLLWHGSYYSELALGLISYTSMGTDDFVGIGSYALIACAIAWLAPGHRGLKAATGAIAIALVIPWFASMMNGFGYITDRWIWILNFTAAYAIVALVPEFIAPTRRVLVGCAIIGLIWLAVALAFPEFGLRKNLICVAVMLGLIVLLGLNRHDVIRRRFRLGLLYPWLLLSLALPGIAMATTMMRTELLEGGEAYAYHFENSPLAAFDETVDPLWRVDGNGLSPVSNNSFITDVNGLDFYNSIYNAAVDRFNGALGITSDDINLKVADLRLRSWLLAALSVKYAIAPTQRDYPLPHGFDETPLAEEPLAIVGEGGDHAPFKVIPLEEAECGIYESDLALPLAYTYPADAVESVDDFMNRPIIEREQALLQGLALDAKDFDAWAASTGTPGDASDPSVGEASDGALSEETRRLSFDESIKPYELQASEGIELGEGAWRVTTPGTVTLTFTGVDNAEAALTWTNLRLAELERSDSGTSLVDALEQWYQLKPNRGGSVQISRPGWPEQSVTVLTNANHMYSGKHDWLVNLGPSEATPTTITLTFATPGLYTFDDLEVATLPYASLDALVSERRNETLEMTATANGYDARVTMEEPGWLYFDIPASSGWSATVNGEAVRPLRANIAFMAVPVEAGASEVVLHYRTPFLIEGITLSLIGLGALIALEVVRRRRSKKRRARRPSVKDATKRAVT